MSHTNKDMRRYLGPYDYYTRGRKGLCDFLNFSGGKCGGAKDGRCRIFHSTKARPHRSLKEKITNRELENE